MSMQILGLALASFSTWASGTGLFLQRLSKLEDDELAAKEKQREGLDWKKIIGFGMNIGGQPLALVGLTFCSASVVSGMQCTTNLLNSICIGIFQGVPFTFDNAATVVLGVAGAVGIISVAPTTDTATDLENTLRLLSFWNYPRLFAWLSVVVSVVAWSAYLIFVAPAVDASKKKEAAQRATMLSFAYPFLAMTSARFSELSFKCIGLLLANGVERAWNDRLFECVIVAILAVIFGPGSVYCITMGARNQDATYYIPTTVAIANTIGATYGVSLGEWDNETQETILKFMCFVCLTLGSVYFSSKPKPSTEEFRGVDAKETAKKTE